MNNRLLFFASYTYTIMKDNKTIRRWLFMLKKFVVKSGMMVGALVASQYIIGKLEERALRRELNEIMEEELSKGEDGNDESKEQKVKLKRVK